MKDSKNIDLAEGDLVILTIDRPTEHPAELIIFLNAVERTYKITEDDVELTKTTNEVHYYPITDEGLEVAKFDAGVTQNNFHRQTKYTVTNTLPKHVLKMDETQLRGYTKTLYDSIIALL